MNSIVIYFRKNHYLVDAVDQKISLFKSAGLIDFWISCFNKAKQKPVVPNGPKVMTFYDLSGIFKVWIFSLIISVAALLAEIIIIKVLLRAKRNKQVA
jgi:hypothetical protein